MCYSEKIGQFFEFVKVYFVVEYDVLVNILSKLEKKIHIYVYF